MRHASPGSTRRAVWFRTWSPLIVWLAWLAFVGVAVWEHARASHQPPIYDAATYATKAQNFWTKVHSLRPFNPLNVEPAFRPPGTILMSYPFGFDLDYRPFYFRSVFLPIVLIGLAVFVIGGSPGRRGAWFSVVMAVFLSTLPGFFYFEILRGVPPITHWGLVDNFLTGIAALAMAACVRAVADRSRRWLAAAAVLSGLAMLVKPAGVLVAALIGVSFAVLAVTRYMSGPRDPEARRAAARWLLAGAMVLIAIDAVVFAAARLSNYLSAGSLAFGNAAIVIMRTELAITWPIMRDVIHWGLGYPFLLWLGCLLVLMTRKRPEIGAARDSTVASRSLGILSASIFAFGVWFWLFGSGGATQIRYFMPFALMGAIAAVPLTERALRRLSLPLRVLLTFALIVPALNMTALLAQREPSFAWQRWTGVNLASGQSDPVLEQATTFIDELQQAGRSATVYILPGNSTDAVFTAATEYARARHPDMPAVQIGRPVDWQRSTTYRVTEMVDADYLLFDPLVDPVRRAAALAMNPVSDFDKERYVLQAWATELSPEDGVQVVSTTPLTRILKVTDRRSLQAAFDKLIARHEWRETFLAANAQQWLTEQEFRREADGERSATLDDVTYGSLARVRRLAVKSSETELTIKLWWEPLPDFQEPDWALFVHTIDGTGKILYADHVPLGHVTPPSADKTMRFDMATLPVRSRDRPLRIAIGFVRAGAPLPKADRGNRDWDGARVIATVP